MPTTSTFQNSAVIPTAQATYRRVRKLNGFKALPEYRDF